MGVQGAVLMQGCVPAPWASRACPHILHWGSIRHRIGSPCRPVRNIPGVDESLKGTPVRKRARIAPASGTVRGGGDYCVRCHAWTRPGGDAGWRGASAHHHLRTFLMGAALSPCPRLRRVGTLEVPRGQRTRAAARPRPGGAGRSGARWSRVTPNSCGAQSLVLLAFN